MNTVHQRQESLSNSIAVAAPKVYTPTFSFNRIITGDARIVMPSIPSGSVDLSFWSPPYYVGKSYERDWSFSEWQSLLSEVIHLHSRILKPGGFMAVNIGDILCFQDESMPRYQADNVRRKKSPVTREQIIKLKQQFPNARRTDLARMLGCSEQTIQRRLEHNNVRGGKTDRVYSSQVDGMYGRRVGAAGWALSV